MLSETGFPFPGRLLFSRPAPSIQLPFPARVPRWAGRIVLRTMRASTTICRHWAYYPLLGCPLKPRSVLLLEQHFYYLGGCFLETFEKNNCSLIRI